MSISKEYNPISQHEAVRRAMGDWEMLAEHPDWNKSEMYAYTCRNVPDNKNRCWLCMAFDCGECPLEGRDKLRCSVDFQTWAESPGEMLLRKALAYLMVHKMRRWQEANPEPPKELWRNVTAECVLEFHDKHNPEGTFVDVKHNGHLIIQLSAGQPCEGGRPDYKLEKTWEGRPAGFNAFKIMHKEIL